MGTPPKDFPGQAATVFLPLKMSPRSPAGSSAFSSRNFPIRPSNRPPPASCANGRLMISRPFYSSPYLEGIPLPREGRMSPPRFRLDGEAGFSPEEARAGRELLVG